MKISMDVIVLEQHLEVAIHAQVCQRLLDVRNVRTIHVSAYQAPLAQKKSQIGPLDIELRMAYSKKEIGQSHSMQIR
jgi:hypothetical protein